MAFLRERLDNGLEVIAETSAHAVSTSVGFFVNTGSRDESDLLWGTSHFLEHMIFKGTESVSGDEINRRFDAMGASANAYTAEEDTVYYATVLPDRQADAVDLIARMMRPALREEDFSTEKLVILEEIRMYDDQPPFGADDQCRAAFFGDHPLARSVLGTVESITALPVEAMRDYHHRRYAPGTMVLAATGAVDFPALVADARRLCGGWESQPDTTRLRPDAPDRAARPGTTRIVRPSATLEYGVRMSPGPSERHADRFAAKLLAAVLGDSSGSRLYWALVDSGDAEQATLHHHEFLDAGLFVTQLSCDADAIDSQFERILEIYRDAATRGIAGPEFDQARNKLASRVVLAGERPRRRLFEVGGEWAHARTYRTVAETLGIVESLTRNDVQQVLERWRLDESASIVLAGPAGG